MWSPSSVALAVLPLIWTTCHSSPIDSDELYLREVESASTLNTRAALNDHSFILTAASGSENHSKRQTSLEYINTEGSISNDCLTAPIYSIVNGTLTTTVGGITYHYSTNAGVGLQQFVPALQAGNITTFFSFSGDGTRLVWANEAFDSGEATFCSMPNSTIYAVFSEAARPAECQAFTVMPFETKSCSQLFDAVSALAFPRSSNAVTSPPTAQPNTCTATITVSQKIHIAANGTLAATSSIPAPAVTTSPSLPTACSAKGLTFVVHWQYFQPGDNVWVYHRVWSEISEGAWGWVNGTTQLLPGEPSIYLAGEAPMPSYDKTWTDAPPFEYMFTTGRNWWDEASQRTLGEFTAVKTRSLSFGTSVTFADFDRDQLYFSYKDIDDPW